MRIRFFIYCVVLVVSLLIDGCGPPTAATQSGNPGSPMPAAPDSNEGDSVAIMIIDDFMIEIAQSNNVDDIIRNGEGKTGSGNCTYALNGQQVYGSKGAQVYGSKGAGVGESKTLDGVPHGELVDAELYNLISQDFPNAVSEPRPDESSGNQWPSWIKKINYWKADDGNRPIFLVAVDTDHYATEIVQQRIVESIGYIENEYGVHRFVLNMSFVIMPCDLGKDKDGKTLYNDYLDLITSTPEINSLKNELDSLMLYDSGSETFIDPATNNSIPEDVARNILLYTPELGSVRLRTIYPSNIDLFQSSPYYQSLINDPIANWLAESSKDPSHPVVSVAAAGNEGISFPFAPGIWDSVVSVSADGEDNGLAPYSNWGEVKLDGKANYNGEDVFGTSFAAPVLSYKEAIYLYNDGFVECKGSEDIQNSPPLGYAPIGGAWKNLPVPDASSQYCTDFSSLSSSPIITPTSTPPATATSSTSSSACVNNSDFVADVTVLDNTQFSAGESFTKTWQLRNSGTCVWDGAYNFVFVGGEQMSGPSSAPIADTVALGETINISVSLVAPTASGTYRGNWRIAAPDGTFFGDTPFVKIVVP